MKEEILKAIQEIAEEIVAIDNATAEQKKALTGFEDTIEEMAPELQATKAALEEAEAHYLQAHAAWEEIYSKYYELDNNRLNALSQIGILQRKRDELETQKENLRQHPIAVIEPAEEVVPE